MLLLDDDDELPEFPTPEELELADILGADGLRAADAALLGAATPRFLKVARIVSDALKSQGLFSVEDAPAALFARRLLTLVDAGLFECVGEPRKPRFCEVRLRHDPARAV